jgi:hypothetical protein
MQVAAGAPSPALTAITDDAASPAHTVITDGASSPSVTTIIDDAASPADIVITDGASSSPSVTTITDDAASPADIVITDGANDGSVVSSVGGGSRVAGEAGDRGLALLTGSPAGTVITDGDDEGSVGSIVADGSPVAVQAGDRGLADTVITGGADEGSVALIVADGSGVDGERSDGALALAAVRRHAPLVAAANRVRWPTFDARTVAEAIRKLERIFSGTCDSKAIATLFVQGKMEAFWAVRGMTDWELCQMWSATCQWVSFEPDAAACLVAAFVRAGMPLRAPFCVDPERVDKAERPDLLRRPPLCWAVRHSPPLARALLDLPSECGLDVDALAGAVPEQHGPIGMVNYVRKYPHDLILRLLHRTDRSVVSRGLVMVDDGPWQATSDATHILVASVLNAAYNDGPGLDAIDDMLARALMLIASAEPDGSGLDLTGGIGVRRHPIGGRACPNLWPDAKFGGILPLVERIYRDFWTSGLAVAGIELLMRSLVAAMQRVRVYRMWMPAEVAFALIDAGVPMPELHALVKAYLASEPHDASRLDHPILCIPLPWA